MGHFGQVILYQSRKLKLERKHCMAGLQCNIVTMKGSQPKVLRLNLEWSDETQTPFYSAAASPVEVKMQGQRMRHSTPASSPESPSTSNTRTHGEITVFSPDTEASSFLVYQRNPLYEKLYTGKHSPIYDQSGFHNSLPSPDSAGERIISLSMSSKILGSDDKRMLWIPQNQKNNENVRETVGWQNSLKNTLSTTRTGLHKQMPQELSMMALGVGYRKNSNRDFDSSSIREAVSLCRSSSTPPPLCSKCQKKSPAFGKPPREFLYEELVEVTEGFSHKNLVAEGGFGLVYKGVLRDGLVVAIKQLKYLRSQGDADFCREVRVLSCAQHRNVVPLIGFCFDQHKRFLVYEYICNGSLDLHLHGSKDRPLEWDLRLKIAIGTARGLRYLHEDCRVGCIIHRDLRPHNILLTHDFEPLVADFGLARLYNEWELCDEEQVVGTIGYLAPEYFSGAKVTEKVDIYSFGLVLLELITGQKNNPLQYHNDQYLLLEKFYLLEAIEQSRLLSDRQKFLDPGLSDYELQNLPYELQAMCHAASLCLQKDPDLRPPMSKVLRILEGGGTMIPMALDGASIGSRSGHFKAPVPGKTTVSSTKHSRRLSL
ncbi:OLC1v1017828C3 [Oldenlandia corymbosa var. corymbosa]|uniref:non-specific serine/threonine protein kinase n=1 Tax=Oldenlandia corymbosa var. corymbosa TaxID=529605 RepID=A0AAV1EA85_OLDCO|nr:OLC1v1017828C3 [Oldenlandia corymbosa var. corymbosa]